MVKDNLGSEIKVGEKALRVDNKWLDTVTIMAIDEKKQTSVCVLSDGGTRTAWTYPYRLIVQDSLTVNL